MARPMDLEILREVLSDKRVHLSLAVVKKVELLDDLTVCRVQVLTLPDELEVVAEVTWDFGGDGAGLFTLPLAEDLVMIAYADHGTAYVLKRLTSATEKVPAKAKDGHTVLQAVAGKMLYLGSDTKTLIGKGGDTDPAEPLVLGLVMKSCLNDVFAKVDALQTQLDNLVTKLISGPIGMGNLGTPVPTYPALATDLTSIKTSLATNKSDFAALKSKYVDTQSTDILSTIAFTERGS